MADLEGLRATGDPGDCIALVGMCHGVFADEYSDERASAAYAALVEIP